MTTTNSAAIQHPDRLFIDGQWAAPSTKVDLRRPQLRDRGALPPRGRGAGGGHDQGGRRSAQRLRQRPLAANEPRRAWDVPQGDRGGAGQARRRQRHRVEQRVGRDGAHREGRLGRRRRRLRLLRGSRRDLHVRGREDARPRQRQVRHDRARAGRRGRRHHSLERAGFARRVQMCARVPRRLHRHPQGVARGARCGVHPRRGRGGGRPAAGRAPTSSPPTAPPPSCSCATPASTR